MDQDIIYGRRSVLEALRCGHPINKLYVLQNASGIPKEIFRTAQQHSIPLIRCHRQRLNRLSGGANHQGVVALLSPISYSTLQQILERSIQRSHPFFALALDGIQDPGNLGALLRTAEAAAVDGVLLGSRRACPVTPTVDKASAGAARLLPITRVRNLAHTLNELRESKIKIIGTSPESNHFYTQVDLTVPLVLAIGSEGEGLSYEVQKSCDVIVKIPLYGRIESLNVSSAAAILIYEVIRQRKLLNY